MSMSQKNKPIVVITDLSNRINYYQWFVYGFQLLAREGKIELKFHIPLPQRLLVFDHSAFLVRCFNKLKRVVGGAS